MRFWKNSWSHPRLVCCYSDGIIIKIISIDSAELRYITKLFQMTWDHLILGFYTLNFEIMDYVYYLIMYLQILTNKIMGFYT